MKSSDDTVIHFVTMLGVLAIAVLLFFIVLRSENDRQEREREAVKAMKMAEMLLKHLPKP